MAELLKKLSCLHGVSGNETAVRGLIISEINDIADEIAVDTMGNIIALKKGKTSGKTIAVTANMDEPGFIISGITDKGYIKFKSVGAVDARKLVSKKVVTQSGIKGVIGMKAIHLQTKDERENVVKVKDLFIDIGAKDKEEAEKTVKLGEYITFDTDYAEMGENVKGKALDRSGACFALINALDSECPYDFYAIFTAQHEVGARGAQIAAHRVNAEVILTVSAAETADMYDCSEGGLKLGDGVCVSYMDARVIPDRPLTDKIIVLATENGIKLQTKVTMPYRTDGCAMQITDTKVISAQIPCRYSHSPVSIMNRGDIDEATKLIKLYLNKIGELI